MSNQNSENWHLATKAVRIGHQRTPEMEHGEPIFPTSSYVFNNAAEAAAIFAGEQQGNIYARFANPTVRNFEQRLAALEGGEVCVATSSGMAAIYATCLGLLEAGDHLVSAKQIFGSTVVLFDKYLTRSNIQTSYADLTDLSSWEKAIQPNTKMLFIESPSNPLTQIADIRALAKLAHDHNCLLAVDNCFCSPALQRPLELGADIVIHSATKYIDGQGRALGGAIVGNKEQVGEAIFGVLRTVGPCMSPFNAWIFLKGLETLAVRMREHCKQAMELALWLQQQPNIEKVNYPGLESHPQFELAKQQQSLAGGLLSFDVKGGKKAAWHLIDQTQILSITANLGDTKTTITHPASTTHGRLTPEARQAAGIGDGLVRIAVGFEDIEDIKADIQRGLTD